MDISMNFAWLFFLYFLVCGLALLVNPRQFIDAVNDILYSKGQMLIVGFIALIFGLFIISFHCYYKPTWELLITVIGWLSFIKGVAYLVFPNSIKKLASYYQNENTLRVNGVVCIIFAAVFGCIIFC